MLKRTAFYSCASLIGISIAGCLLLLILVNVLML